MRNIFFFERHLDFLWSGEDERLGKNFRGWNFPKGQKFISSFWRNFFPLCRCCCRCWLDWQLRMTGLFRMLSIAAKESCIERVKDGHAMNGKKVFVFEKWNAGNLLLNLCWKKTFEVKLSNWLGCSICTQLNWLRGGEPLYMKMEDQRSKQHIPRREKKTSQCKFCWLGETYTKLN